MIGNPPFGTPAASSRRGRRPLLRLAAWGAATVLESGVLAYSMGRVLFGPVSISPHPLLWAGWVAAAAAIYLCLSALATAPLFETAYGAGARRGVRLWWTALPFLAIYAVGLLILQIRPDTVRQVVWSVLSPIEPFPTMAMAIGILVAFLAKTAIALAGRPRESLVRGLAVHPSDVGIPLSLIVVGILQATVYIIPIGNAFLRSWAIADAVLTGTRYPVTDTELPTLLAGGPPFIRDLPLFPLMLLAAFDSFGHNTAAAQLPAMLASAAFPLALYLLLFQATQSRVLSILFASLVSLFPFLRFWVLNLPDPDPLMLTFLCISGYLYLRAADSPQSWARWLSAGIAAGLLSLIRSEGILYAGCIGLGVLALRPGVRRVAAFAAGVGIFVVPMMAVWLTNFGMLWPQNFNGTLRPGYPLENIQILGATDAFGLYQRGLGLDATGAVFLLLLCLLSVVAGTVIAAVRRQRLLALVVPGIGNFVSVFFTSPGVTNAQHFADFFRHASFGIPFMAVASAFGLVVALRRLDGKGCSRLIWYLAVLMLVGVVVREGDILANPTATHRPGATQVLTTSTHLSAEAIVEHPLELPLMTYRSDGDLAVAYPTFMKWPDGILEYFHPLDMTFDSAGRPFGYAPLVALVVALTLAFLAEGQSIGRSRAGSEAGAGETR